MSSSSKKKLRADAGSAKLTERQLNEKKEAQKLKIYTIAFAAVLAILIVIAVTVGVTRTIESSGVREKNTTAATVGSHSISNAELTYFYRDAISSFSSNYGGYLQMLTGIDPTLPLDQQYTDSDNGTTWAEYFIDAAINNAQSTYAMVDAAAAEGFTLSDDDKAQLDSISSTLDLYASMSGVTADSYIKQMYGNGATKKGYLEYYEHNLLASAYLAHHQDSMTYTDAQLREADSKDPSAYNSYSYNQYYLTVNKFLTGGTTAEDGTVTYTDEERSMAAMKAEAAVKELTSGSITTVEAFDEAIAAMSVNEGTSVSSTAYSNQRSNSINTAFAEWIMDASRNAGDMTYVANSTTDENGNENITSFYVVMYNGMTDNTYSAVNVRHILVGYEGGSTAEDGTTVYSDAEKMLARASAETILADWKNGDASEDSFAALANEKSTDGGSNTNGGLYENIAKGQMVAPFEAWCFDSSRQAGDTGIVETEYGVHVMYFVGTADINYRDYLITNDLKNEDLQNWYDSSVAALPTAKGDTKYIPTGVVMGTNT